MARNKIVIITRHMLGGGAERVIAQLSNYFVEHGKTCSIITLDKEEVFYDLDSRITVMPIGAQKNSRLLDKIKRYQIVRKIVKKEQPDLVLSLPEEIGVYVLLGLLGTGIPVYVSERNNPWVMPDVKITRILRTLMYPFAKGIIFQTEMAKSFFPTRIQKKGIVLPNPVDASRIPEPYDGLRENWIAAVGRLEPQKSFGLLIRAFKQFYSHHPDYTLVIFGEGSERKKLESLAMELGCENAVQLPGRDKNVLEKIRKASMFVLSSDYEGMPNVLLEAMCMGMPVISTDCPSGGPKELIEDGVNGLLVPVGDETAMYQALEKMADADFAAGLASCASQIREKLTSEEVFEKWYAYLF